MTPTVVGQSRFQFGGNRRLPDVHPHVRWVTAGSAADKAGLKINDVVLAVDGQAGHVPLPAQDAIAKKPDQLITLSILRDGQPQTIQATPVKTGSEGILGIGIGDETVSLKPGAGRSDHPERQEKHRIQRADFSNALGPVHARDVAEAVMGPVAIAQLSGESAQLGWIALFSLMASISLNLGLLNLMPIPVLDGGHISSWRSKAWRVGISA